MDSGSSGSAVLRQGLPLDRGRVSAEKDEKDRDADDFDASALAALVGTSVPPPVEQADAKSGAKTPPKDDDGDGKLDLRALVASVAPPAPEASGTNGAGATAAAAIAAEAPAAKEPAAAKPAPKKVETAKSTAKAVEEPRVV